MDFQNWGAGCISLANFRRIHIERLAYYTMAHISSNALNLKFIADFGGNCVTVEDLDTVAQTSRGQQFMYKNALFAASAYAPYLLQQSNAQKRQNRNTPTSHNCTHRSPSATFSMFSYKLAKVTKA